MIILLRGVPGTGKTTTSALIRDRLIPAVRVCNDDIRYLAAPRDFSAFSLGTSEEACFALASTYAHNGLTPVIDGVFEDIEMLKAWAQSLSREGIKLYVVSLRCNTNDLISRNRSRPVLARMNEKHIIGLNSRFKLFGIVIDIDNHTPEEVASDVLDSIEGLDSPGTLSNLDNRSKSILFLRHGEPEFPSRTYPNHMNMDLSSKGMAEARAARSAVERFKPEVIYASDMKRALHTAEIATNSGDIIPVKALRERSFRCFYDIPLSNIPDDLAGAIVQGNTDHFNLPGEETLANARTRLYNFLDEMINSTEASRILLVSHGGPHAWLLEKALGVNLAGNRNLTLHTGNFSKFTANRCGLSVDYINCLAKGVF